MPVHTAIFRLKPGQTSLHSIRLPHDHLRTGYNRTSPADSLASIILRDSLARALLLRFKTRSAQHTLLGPYPSQHDRSGMSSSIPGRRATRQHHPCHSSLKATDLCSVFPVKELRLVSSHMYPATVLYMHFCHPPYWFSLHFNPSNGVTPTMWRTFETVTGIRLLSSIGRRCAELWSITTP